MSCGTRPGDSDLGGWAAWCDESEIFDACQAESNLVQAKIFSGACRSWGRIATEAGGVFGIGGVTVQHRRMAPPLSAGGSCHASAPAPVRGGSHIYTVRHRATADRKNCQLTANFFRVLCVRLIVTVNSN